MLSQGLTYELRGLRPGDLGWIIHRHGVLYAAECGWGEKFEALVASIAADIVQKFNPERERVWVADRSGERLGSIFLVSSSPAKPEVAKMRLLLVEPAARGLGLGTRLVHEATNFARHCGYHKVELWTHKELATAQHIYAKAGFQLVQEEMHEAWGVPVVGQIWERDLLEP